MDGDCSHCMRELKGKKKVLVDQDITGDNIMLCQACADRIGKLARLMKELP